MNRIAQAVMLMLAGGLVTFPARAANVFSTDSNIQVVKVSIEGCSQDDCKGQVFLTFNKVPVNAAACSKFSSGYWKVGGDDANVEAIKSMAIAAKLAGNPVNIAWNDAGGATSCTSAGYPVVRLLQLR